MRRDLGKSLSGRLDAPPRYVEFPMRRTLGRWFPSFRPLWLFGSFRPGGARLRPRGRDRIHERHEAPDRPGDQAASPEHRPGRRAAQLHRELRTHVDLSQADRLHREVDRGHRRQGEEGRCARHPLRARAGRGACDEEGDRRARPGADRAGQGGGGGSQGRCRGGRGARQRGRGDPGQVPGRGRSLGLGGQAAPERGRQGRGRSPGPLRVDQSAQVEHRGAGQGEGNHQAGEGGAAFRASHAHEGPGRRQGRRGRLESGRERGEICARPGWTTSRSPPRSTA